MLYCGAGLLCVTPFSVSLSLHSSVFLLFVNWLSLSLLSSYVSLSPCFLPLPLPSPPPPPPSLSLFSSFLPFLQFLFSLLGNHASVRNLSFSFSRISSHPHTHTHTYIRGLHITNTFSLSLPLALRLPPSGSLSLPPFSFSLLYSLSLSLSLSLSRSFPIYPAYSFRPG